ncbi:MAG: hypothetical protein Q4A81_04920 [Pasteurellaceae bacterium]|nr:hypothetical protein [Pasteurellaceae bacterium]
MKFKKIITFGLLGGLSFVFIQAPLQAKTQTNDPLYSNVLNSGSIEKNPEAQYALALVLEGNQDYQNAFLWFEKAAQQNYSKAYLKLAQYYEFHLGIKKNLSKAKYWYEKCLGDEELKLDAQMGLQRIEG